MLKYLFIKNIALISELQMEFENNFNVLTGETGAGKTIIINAFKLLLGNRVGNEVIRKGETTAYVEAVFELKGLKGIGEFKELIEESENELIVSREFNRNGHNKCFVNNKRVNLSLISELINRFVDIHSQNQQQSLLDNRVQLEMLDGFLNLFSLKKKLSKELEKYRNISSELNKLTQKKNELKEKIDFIKFKYDEIKAANLSEKEDAELEQEKSVLENSSRLYELSENIYNTLYEKDNSVASQFSILNRELEELIDVDKTLKEPNKKLQRLFEEVNEIALFFRDYRENINFSQNRLEEINLRLSTIDRLKSKYGKSIKEILKNLKEIEKELETAENIEIDLSKLEEQRKSSLKKLTEIALELSKKREEGKGKLEKQIIKSLKDLAMKDVNFSINLNWQEDKNGIPVNGRTYLVTESGLDNAEYLISPNKGEDLKPLNKIASGGEISRIMLAIKEVFAAQDRTDVLVFDELDVGIGGKTADRVGEKLVNIARRHHLIVITHLPQIASKAKTHFSVYKETEKGRTLTRIKKLNMDERIQELAKLISGEKVTDLSLKHAKELLKK